MDETVQQRLWNSVQYQDIYRLDAALKEGADVNYQYARLLLKNSSKYNSAQ
jgi:hypothetical protein